MKKTILILFIILLSKIPVAFCEFPRHIDPNILIADNPGHTALFGKYSEIYGFIVSGDYESAILQLKVIDEIPATSDVKEVISEYNDLLSNVIDELIETQTGIAQGYNYLEYLMDIEAEISLSDSLNHLLTANSINNEIDSESVSFGDLLKGSPQVLLEGNEELKKRIEYLMAIVDQGLKQVNEIQEKRLQGLMDSFIELTIDDYNPLLGSSIRVNGRLVSEKRFLANKNIEFYIQGGFLDSVDTDENGEFSYDLKVPYIYKKQLVIRIEYFPVNEDILNFTPSFIEEIINPIYYTPVIHAQIPNSVYPGQEYEIRGRIEFPGDTQLSISLEFFGSSLSQKSNNEFTFRFLVPKGLPDNKLSVKLSTSSNGLIGPAQLVKEINIEYLRSNLVFEQTFFVFLLSSLEVRGSLESQGLPVEKSSIECSLGNQRLKTVTDSNGRFKVNIDINPLSFSSRRIVIITAVPTEPWIKGDQLIKTVTIVNILTLIPLPLFIIVILYIQRLRVTLVVGETPIIRDIEQTPKYQILSGFSLVYQGALNIIQSRTGIKIAANDTLREYLNAMKVRLPRRIFRLFRQVTGYYERWVYGANKRRPPIKVSTQIVSKMSDADE